MKDSKATTGMWIRLEDPEGFPARIHREGGWVPRPLPSELALTPLTYQILAASEQALGRLDEAAERLPDREYLVYYTMLREAQSSAALENAHVSLREVLRANLPGVKAGPDVEPILRYLEASRAAFTNVRGGAEIDLPLLGRISSQLAPEPPAAERFWREGTSWVGGRTRGEAVLVHTPPGPHLQAAAQQWQEWVGAPCDLPLVGKLAMGHQQLELIHPFAGGNGYVARLYVSLELVRAGVLRDQILPLSLWLDRNRTEYHQRLREVVDTGDFEKFVVFFADGIRHLCGEQIDLIKRMEQLRARHLEKVNRSGNVRKVASGLIGMPFSNHHSIAERFGMSRKGANDVARELERAGLLKVEANKRYKKIFICEEVLDLLSTHDPVAPAEDREVFG
ncbi:Fic family protein [Amycolatopsis sp. NPDC059027]|uniref:Fic family protein n=1 Tax=Amycolatopsis sp. NPDC059027 TaxID=3346709 RepID=UPI00366AF72C